VAAILSGKPFSQKTPADPLGLSPIITAGFAAGGSSNNPMADNLTKKLAAAALSGASHGEC